MAGNHTKHLEADQLSIGKRLMMHDLLEKSVDVVG